MSDVSLSRTLRILDPKGLHARAAARFVACASEFQSRVTVFRDGHSVEGTSIMGLLMLAAAFGTEIELRVTGPDAEDTLEALAALVHDDFVGT